MTIRSRRVDATLHLDVVDDGVGLDGERQEFEEGHGLGNVQRRLQAFYRGRGSLTLAPAGAGGGTIARLDSASGRAQPGQVPPRMPRGLPRLR